MSEKICTSGHVMNDGDVTCQRCGSSAQLQDNLNTNMENDENKVAEAEAVATDETTEEKVEESADIASDATEKKEKEEGEKTDSETEGGESKEEAPEADTAE